MEILLFFYLYTVILFAIFGLMKNSKYRGYIPSPTAQKKHSLVPILGFHGYYVDRFNDVYSFYTNSDESPIGEGRVVAVNLNRTPERSLECLALADNVGKRRLRSRRKLLIGTLGKEEFERREALRAERAVILEKEKAEREIQRAKQDAETEKMLQEMHKDDFSGPKAPLLSLDPLVRNMVKKARAKREQETLGDLF